MTNGHGVMPCLLWWGRG